MKTKLFYILLTAMLVLTLVPPSQALEPSLLNLTIEGIRNTEIEGETENIPCIEINFTFALSSVNAWGDKTHYLLWKGKQSPDVIGNWSLGYTADDPPQLQGLFGWEGCLQYTIISSEFPYDSVMIEGRLYYLYRVHIYVDNTIKIHDKLYFGGEYDIWPTLQGSSLQRLKVKKVLDTGEVIFKSKRLHG